MPASLEAYYQESGRAGRDGAEARCTLLYQLDDRRTQLFFLGGRYPKAEDLRAVCDALRAAGADAAPVPLAPVQELAPGVAKTKVRVALSLLKDAGVVRETRGVRFRLLRTEVTSEEVDRIAETCAGRGECDREKLERVMLYGQSAVCRWKLLHEYFGEEFEPGDCGHCDNCLHPLEEQLGLSAAADEPPPHAEEEALRERAHGGRAIFTSTVEPGGLDPLRDFLREEARNLRPDVRVRLSSSQGAVLAEIYREGEVLERVDKGEEITLRARLSQAMVGRLRSRGVTVHDRA
jgi:hypothetical protein